MVTWGLQAENKVDLCEEVRSLYNSKNHNLNAGKDTKDIRKLLLATLIMKMML